MKTKRSILTAIVWLLVLLCLFLCASEVFSSHSTEHICSGEDCMICYASLLEHITIAIVLQIGVFFTICLTCGIYSNNSLFSLRLYTPVYFKVKLSN